MPTPCFPFSSKVAFGSLKRCRPLSRMRRMNTPHMSFDFLRIAVLAQSTSATAASTPCQVDSNKESFTRPPNAYRSFNTMSGGLEQRESHPPTQCLVASMSPELQEVLQLPHVFVLTCKFLQRRRQRRLSATCQDNRRLFRRWRHATRLAGFCGIVDPAYYSDEDYGDF